MYYVEIYLHGRWIPVGHYASLIQARLIYQEHEGVFERVRIMTEGLVEVK